MFILVIHFIKWIFQYVLCHCFIVFSSFHWIWNLLIMINVTCLDVIIRMYFSHSRFNSPFVNATLCIISHCFLSLEPILIWVFTSSSSSSSNNFCSHSIFISLLVFILFLFRPMRCICSTVVAKYSLIAAWRF
jgi:hypothetical protein